jgi:hypothetical protein
MAPAALEGILKRGPFRFSAETGCGGSTIVLSQSSDHHTAFAIEGANLTITELRKHVDLRAERVTFVEGETKDTLPGHVFPGELDLVLLDGPHAYPLPAARICISVSRPSSGRMAGHRRSSRFPRFTNCSDFSSGSPAWF